MYDVHYTYSGNLLKYIFIDVKLIATFRIKFKPICVNNCYSGASEQREQWGGDCPYGNNSVESSPHNDFMSLNV